MLIWSKSGSKGRSSILRQLRNRHPAGEIEAEGFCYEFHASRTRDRSQSDVAAYERLRGAHFLLAVWKEQLPYHEIGDLPSDVHAALTVLLGWLLVFRTNASYLAGRKLARCGATWST